MWVFSGGKRVLEITGRAGIGGSDRNEPARSGCDLRALSPHRQSGQAGQRLQSGCLLRGVYVCMYVCTYVCVSGEVHENVFTLCHTALKWKGKCAYSTYNLFVHTYYIHP